MDSALDTETSPTLHSTSWSPPSMTSVEVTDGRPPASSISPASLFRSRYRLARGKKGSGRRLPSPTSSNLVRRRLERPYRSTLNKLLMITAILRAELRAGMGQDMVEVRVGWGRYAVFETTVFPPVLLALYGMYRR